MNLSFHGRSHAAVPLAVCCLIASHVRADVGEARNAFAEWARVKSQVAQEKSDWARERALLADTLATARAETEALEKRISEIKSSSTQADTRRAELTAAIDEARGSSDALAQVISGAEAEIRSLLPVLPAPLTAELQPLLARLPADGKAARLPISQRLQTIAALLAQIEKFSTGLSLMSEIRTLADGQAREVKTLYFGLGAAFFSDASGTISGYGSAGPTGWDWKTAEGDTALRISRAIAIHENTQPPAFVALPVEIK